MSTTKVLGPVEMLLHVAYLGKGGGGEGNIVKNEA